MFDRKRIEKLEQRVSDLEAQNDYLRAIIEALSVGHEAHQEALEAIEARNQHAAKEWSSIRN
jgi:DNA-binding transcriptional regulator YbjK